MTRGQVRSLVGATIVLAVLTAGLPAAHAEVADPRPLITQVSDINPQGSSNPAEFVVADDVLYFGAGDAQDDRQLWAHDAAANGGQGSTYRVTDLVDPGFGGPSVRQLTLLDGRIFFVADTPATGDELYVYDPATDETQLAADVVPGPEGSFAEQLTVAGDDLYFKTDDLLLETQQLWEFDPSSGGAGGLRKILDVGVDSGFSVGVGMGDTLYLVGAIEGLTEGQELLAYDTTSDALVAVTNFTGRYSFVVNVLGSEYGRVYLQAYTTARGYEPYDFDPATGRTRLVADLKPGSAASSPSYVEGLDGMVYFPAAGPQGGVELWRFDPVTRAVQLAADISASAGGDPASSSFPSGLTAVDGKLYLAASRNPRQGAYRDAELWVFDPSAAGAASMVQELFTGTAAKDGSNPTGMTAYDGAVFFTARGDVDGYELYRYDQRPHELAAVLYAGAEVSAPGTVKVTTYLRNNTGSAVSGRLLLQVGRPDGTLVTRTVGTEQQIPPGGTRTVTVSVPIGADDAPGRYEAVLALVTADRRTLAADDFVFDVVGGS